MRTKKSIEDLITGIIISLKNEDQFERKTAKRIIEALIDEDNLSISPIDDSLFRNFIRSNHLTKEWDKFFEQNKEQYKLTDNVKSCNTCFYSQNGKTSCDRHVNPIKPDYSKGVECAANNYIHYKPAIKKQKLE
jgi:uncharacterized protein YdaT